MVQVRQIFATQSDHAIGKAVDAAVAKAAKCEDGRAFAKVRRPSASSQNCQRRESCTGHERYACLRSCGALAMRLQATCGSAGILKESWYSSVTREDV